VSLIKRRAKGVVPKTCHANIKLPASLHATMKRIRYERSVEEEGDVKLCRIYREAVEMYINSEPVQQLLKGGTTLRATG